MSNPNPTGTSSRGVIVPKPKADIYTLLLALSLIAIIIGCIFLVLELGRYDYEVVVDATHFDISRETAQVDAATGNLAVPDRGFRFVEPPANADFRWAQCSRQCGGTPSRSFVT